MSGSRDHPSGAKTGSDHEPVTLKRFGRVHADLAAAGLGQKAERTDSGLGRVGPKLRLVTSVRVELSLQAST